MNSETNKKADYRYPGFRPFYDNDIDRHLFFGRDKEKEALLYKGLADNLVVLYARSGLGKTSLLNAGLSHLLCKRREKGIIKMTDEVESFQLQLLCRHIEDMAQERAIEEDGNNFIRKEDIGGEAEMQQVLERFYDNQIKKLDTIWNRRKARKLFEKGLISINDLRLSLEEGDIKRRFRVPKNLLADMVNSRLLRAESRVGSVYYELSHDTLVAPIRESQKKSKSKRTKIKFVFFFCILIITILSPVIDKISLQNKKNIAVTHLLSGIEHYEKKEFKEAIEEYKNAIKIDPKLTSAYNNKGNAHYRQHHYSEAIAAYKKAIEIEPKYFIAYYNMATAYYGLKKYNESILVLKKAIEINPESISAKIFLAEAYLITERFNDTFTLADSLLKGKEISTQHILVLRLVLIGSLVFQGKQTKAAAQLNDFVQYYISIPGDFERDWEYNTVKNFIIEYKKLPAAQTKLLLQLVDLLESPKKEGDKKLSELETSIREIFK